MNSNYLRPRDLPQLPLGYNQSTEPQTTRTQTFIDKISSVHISLRYLDGKTDFEREASRLFKILSNLLDEHPSYNELIQLVPVLKAQKEAIETLLQQQAGIDKEGTLHELALSLKDLEDWVNQVKAYDWRSAQLGTTLREVTEASYRPLLKGIDPDEIKKAEAERRLRFLETPPWEKIVEKLCRCAEVWKKSTEKLDPHAEVFVKELSSRLMQDFKDSSLPLSTLSFYEEMRDEVTFLKDEVARLTKTPPQNVEEAQALLEVVIQLETVQEHLREAQAEIRETCLSLKKMQLLLKDNEKLLGELNAQIGLLEGNLSSLNQLSEKIKKVDQKQAVILAATAMAKNQAIFDDLVRKAFNDPSQHLSAYLTLSILKKEKNLDPSLKNSVPDALKTLKGLLGDIEPILADKEMVRQALSLKRPKQERSWWGKLWHPEEWPDSVKNILRVGFSAMQVAAETQRVYQRVSSVQSQAIRRTLAIANLALPQEKLKEISKKLYEEWNQQGGWVQLEDYDASNVADSRALTEPRAKRYQGTQSEWDRFQETRGLELVEQYCEEHQISLPTDFGIFFSQPQPTGEGEAAKEEEVAHVVKELPPSNSKEESAANNALAIVHWLPICTPLVKQEAPTPPVIPSPIIQKPTPPSGEDITQPVPIGDKTPPVGGKIPKLVEEVPVISLETSQVQEEEPLPAIFPIMPRERQAVHDALQYGREVEAAIDRQYYANLAGLLGAELDNPILEEKKLSGYMTTKSLSLLIEAHKAYLSALKKGVPTDAESIREAAIVERSLAKFEQALELTRLLETSRRQFQERLAKELTELPSGENLFFAAGWRGNKEPGHAVVYEVEKQPDQKLVVRVFNTGGGTNYHTAGYVSLERRILPYVEFVDVPFEQFTAPATVDYLVSLQQDIPEIVEEWSGENIYQVLLPVIGGGISRCEHNLEELKSPQYVGNCAVASPVAMMDKLMGSEPLALRMRFLTLARATEEFYLSNQAKFASNEGYRRLLIKGCKSTLEAGQKALESGGFSGVAIGGALEQTKSILQEALILQEKDLQAPAGAVLEIAPSNVWSSSTSPAVPAFEELKNEVEASLKTTKEFVPTAERIDPIPKRESIDWSNVHEKLALLSNHLKTETIGSRDGLYISREGIRELPLDPALWNKVPEERVRELLTSLSTIQEYLFVNVVKRAQDENRVVFSDELLALYKTHVIIDQLSRRSSEILAKELPPSTPSWVKQLRPSAAWMADFNTLTSSETEVLPPVSTITGLPPLVRTILNLVDKWSDKATLKRDLPLIEITGKSLLFLRAVGHYDLNKLAAGRKTLLGSLAFNGLKISQGLFSSDWSITFSLGGDEVDEKKVAVKDSSLAWPVSELVHLNEPDYENTLFHVSNDPLSHGVRRDMPPQKTILETPIDLPLILRQGFEKTREILDLSRKGSLQATDILAQYKKQLASFLEIKELELFEELLSTPGALERSLEADEHFVETITSFFTSAHKLGGLFQEPLMMSFLAYLERTSIHRLSKALEGTGKEETLVKKGGSVFSQQIHEFKDHANALQLIHYFRIRSLEKHESLTAEEMGELLGSYAYLRIRGFPYELRNNPRYNRAQIDDIVLMRSKSSVREMLRNPSTRQTLLNGVVRGIDPDFKEAVWTQESENTFISRHPPMRYNMNTGELEFKFEGVVSLPMELAEDPLFKTIFPTPPDRILALGEQQYTYSSPQEDYRFLFRSGKYVIQKKIEGEWFQAVTKAPITGFPLHHSKEETNSVFWMPSKKERGRFYHQFLMGEPFQLNFKKGSNGWQAIEETKGALVDTGHLLEKNLKRFEDPKFTLVFQNEQGPSAIRFPRYGLTLQKTRDGLFTDTKLDGFGLAANSEAYLAVMGDFHQYLPLKRGDQKAVLIPHRPFEEQKTAGVLTTPTKLEELKESWSSTSSFFLYHLEGGKLIVQANSQKEKVQGNIFLATLMLSEQRYTESLEALREAERTIKSMDEPLPEEVLKELYVMANFKKINADPSASAEAIRLHALTLLLWHEAFRFVEGRASLVTEKDKEELSKTYEAYLTHLGRVDEPLLLRAEEERILQSALPDSFQIRTRKGMLANPERPLVAPWPGSTTNMDKWSLMEETTAAAFSKEELLSIPEPIANFAAPAHAVSTSNLFLKKAFPEKLVPLYALMRSHLELGEIPTKDLARQFGLPETLSRKEVKRNLEILLELRYRYLSVVLLQAKQEGEGKHEVKHAKELDEEIELTRLLLHVARLGESEAAVSEVEKTLTPHSDMVGALRYLSKKMGSTEEVDREVKEEAERLWHSWAAPKAARLQTKQIETIAANCPAPVPTITQPLEGRKWTEAEKVVYQHLPPSPDSAQAERAKLQQPVQGGAGLLSEQRQPIGKVASPFSGIVSDQRVVNTVFNTYEKDFAAYQKKLPGEEKIFRVSDPAAMDTFMDNLGRERQNAQQRIAALETELLETANKMPEDPSLRSLVFAKQARGSWRPITLNDLKVAFAKGWDARGLRLLNEELSPEAARSLMQGCFKLLLEMRAEQRIARILSAAEQARKEGFSNPFLMGALDKVLSEKMEYDPYKNPFLLLAEVEYNLSLWKAQLPAIQALGPEKQASAIVELAMGMGKTDLISPAVLTVMADGKTLPILIMPAALLPSMALRLQERMGQAYDREIRVLPITRRQRSGEELRRLTEELRTMTEQRIPLVWSAEDMQTLVNSFTEELEAPQEKEKHLEAVTAWKELFTFLHTSAVVLGDELHAVLDILTSYHFTLGASQPVSKDEAQAVAQFYGLALSHLTEEERRSLTEESFKKELAPRLVNAAIEDGIVGTPRAKEWMDSLTLAQKEKIRNYLLSAPSASQEEVEALILREDQLLPSDLEQLRIEQKALKPDTRLAEEYRKLGRQIRNSLAVYKESLRAIFVSTATAQLGKHYTLNRDGSEAIPSEEGIPQWDSLFGSSLERLYYTLQAFVKTGVPKDVVAEDLRQMQTELRKEIAAEVISSDNFEQHPLFLSFQAKYGEEYKLQLTPYKEEDIVKLTRWVNTHPTSQIELIRTHILPNLKIYKNQIESSTHLLSLIAKKEGGVKGMSGTFFNRATFPDIFGKTLLSDTIHQVVESIKRTSPQTVKNLPIDHNPSKQLDILASVQEPPIGSIIDTTGLFAKTEMEQYARGLLARLPSTIQGVVYYDKNELRVAERDNAQSELYDKERRDPSTLAAIWDVSHTTGSDIRLGKKMNAALIVGKHIKLYQLAQAAMRLRGLGKGQTVEIVLAEADYPVVCQMLKQYLRIEIPQGQRLSVDQLLQYALLNELVSEAENNFRALEMRMRMALMEPVLALLWDTSNPPQEADKIYGLCRTLFIQEHGAESWDAYGAPIFQEDLVKAKKQLLYKWRNHPAVKNIQSTVLLDLKPVFAKWDQLLAADAGLLPDKVEIGKTLGEKQRMETKVQQKVVTKVVEKVQEKVAIKKKTMERTARRIGKPVPLRRKPYAAVAPLPGAKNPFTKDSQKPLPFEQAIASTRAALQEHKGASVRAEDLLRLSPALDGIQLNEPGLLFSLNLAPVWRVEGESMPVHGIDQLFQKKPKHALLIEDKTTGERSLKLLDANDYEQLLPKLKEPGTGDLKLALYQLEDDRIIASGKQKIALKGFQDLIVKAKFLSGMTHYTEAEVRALDNWLSKQDVDKVAHSFFFGIAQHREETAFTFADSVLAKRLLRLGATMPTPAPDTQERLEAIFMDTSLSPRERWDKLQTLKEQLGDSWPATAEAFAPYLTPLLPLLYSTTDGVADDRKNILKTFFPSFGEAYLAWKTAVPALQVNTGMLSSNLGVADLAAAKLVDANTRAGRLLKVDQKNKLSPPQPKSASVAQLETMSELAHPTEGIGYSSLAKAASGNVNFVASLEAGQKMNQLKEPERLYGIFAFLANQKMEAEARCDYGFILGRRLFANQLDDKSLSFAEFIGSQMFEEVTSVSPTELQGELSKLLEASNDNFPEKILNELSTGLKDTVLDFISGGIIKSKSPQEKVIEAYGNIFKPFTLRGSSEQIVAAAEWTNNAMAKLVKEQKSSWMVDQLVLQLLSRKEPLLDHKTLEAYIRNKHDRSTYLETATSFRDDRLNIANFDLLVWATDIKTKNPPPYTPEKVAGLIKDQIGDPAVQNTMGLLLQKLHSQLPEKRRLEDPTRKALSELIIKVEPKDARFREEDFQIKNVDPLRLAMRYTDDINEREEWAIQDLKNIFGHHTKMEPPHQLQTTLEGFVNRHFKGSEVRAPKLKETLDNLEFIRTDAREKELYTLSIQSRLLEMQNPEKRKVVQAWIQERLPAEKFRPFFNEIMLAVGRGGLKEFESNSLANYWKAIHTNGQEFLKVHANSELSIHGYYLQSFEDFSFVTWAADLELKDLDNMKQPAAIEGIAEAFLQKVPTSLSKAFYTTGMLIEKLASMAPLSVTLEDSAKAALDSLIAGVDEQEGLAQELLNWKFESIHHILVVARKTEDPAVRSKQLLQDLKGAFKGRKLLFKFLEGSFKAEELSPKDIANLLQSPEFLESKVDTNYPFVAKVLLSFTSKGTSEQVAAAARAVEANLASSKGGTSSLLPEVVVQLLSRKEPLLDHTAVKKYFSGSNMARLERIIQLVPELKGKESLIKIPDVDLVIWATDLKTRNTPSYTSLNVAGLIRKQIVPLRETMPIVLEKLADQLSREKSLDSPTIEGIKALISEIEEKGPYPRYELEKLSTGTNRLLSIIWNSDRSQTKAQRVHAALEEAIPEKRTLLRRFLVEQLKGEDLATRENMEILKKMEDSREKVALVKHLKGFMDKVDLKQYDASYLKVCWGLLSRHEKEAFVSSKLSYWNQYVGGGANLKFMEADVNFEFVAEVLNIDYKGKKPLPIGQYITNLAAAAEKDRSYAVTLLKAKLPEIEKARKTLTPEQQIKLKALETLL